MEGKRRKRQAVRYSLIQQLVFKYMLNVTTANNVPRKYQSLFFFFYLSLNTIDVSHVHFLPTSKSFAKRESVK